MRLVILDRDGVINEDSDAYIKSPDEWRPIPGSLDAIARLNHDGFRVVVATNQSGVGRGMYDMDMLNRINLKMLDAVQHVGGNIDAVFVCPHIPDDACRCRKPKAGLFEEIAERLKVNLSGVYAVGDSPRDVVAARCVHARPVLVRTGKGERVAPDSEELRGVPVFADLAAFTEALLSGKLPA